MAEPTVNQLVATTIQNYHKQFADNVSNSNAITALLREGNRVRVIEGAAIGAAVGGLAGAVWADNTTTAMPTVMCRMASMTAARLRAMTRRFVALRPARSVAPRSALWPAR